MSLEKRRRELEGADLAAFSQLYWDQVVRVYSEMRTEARGEAEAIKDPRETLGIKDEEA